MHDGDESRGQQRDGGRGERRRRLRCEWGESGQMVEEAGEPVGLGHDAIGEALHDRGVVGGNVNQRIP